MKTGSEIKPIYMTIQQHQIRNSQACHGLERNVIHQMCKLSITLSV
jgi:hypothetical protein